MKPEMMAMLRMRKTVTSTELVPGAERVQQLGHGVGGEGAPAVGELGRVGVDLGAAVEEQGDHDAGDHEEDEPGRLGVAAVEAGLALETLRGVLQADDGEGDEGEEDGDGEEVLDEADPVPGADAAGCGSTC